MPRPVWARRGFADTGRAAWDNLLRVLSKQEIAVPMSVYVHVPFCRTRCAFCDCHSTVASPKKATVMREYADRLVKEIRMWSRMPGLAERPITTVHFGGGTPNHLPDPALSRVLEALHENLRISPDTEWAIETTGRHVDPECFRKLQDWGFT